MSEPITTQQFNSKKLSYGELASIKGTGQYSKKDISYDKKPFVVNIGSKQRIKAYLQPTYAYVEGQKLTQEQKKAKRGTELGYQLNIYLPTDDKNPEIEGLRKIVNSINSYTNGIIPQLIADGDVFGGKETQKEMKKPEDERNLMKPFFTPSTDQTGKPDGKYDILYLPLNVKNTYNDAKQKIGVASVLTPVYKISGDEAELSSIEELMGKGAGYSCEGTFDIHFRNIGLGPHKGYPYVGDIKAFVARCALAPSMGDNAVVIKSDTLGGFKVRDKPKATARTSSGSKSDEDEDFEESETKTVKSKPLKRPELENEDDDEDEKPKKRVPTKDILNLENDSENEEQSASDSEEKPKPKGKKSKPVVSDDEDAPAPKPKPKNTGGKKKVVEDEDEDEAPSKPAPKFKFTSKK